MRRTSRTTRRISALAAIGAMTAALLAAAQAPASAANLISNPGFETAGTDGMPQCWEKSGWGDNDFTIATTTDAHAGTKAMKVNVTRRVEGDRKVLITESAACAPAVTPDSQYDLSLWYKSTTPDASITLFRHDATAGWQYWTDLKTLDLSASYAQATVRTPAVPAGTDRITWGVSVYGTGAVTTDDYAMAEVTPPPVDPVCSGTAQECAKGKWNVLPTQNPVRSMHSVVLKNGKVLLIAGSGNDPAAFAAGTFTSAVYDPVKGTYKTIPTPADMFCSGHVQLADGRVLVMSGNKAYPTADGKVGYEGLKDSYLFDPDTETYTRTNDMNDGHWYPSATVLGSGDVVSFGGLREDSTGSVTAEKFSAAQNKWLPMNQVNQTWSYWGLYPSMILMQDGRLFYSGSHVFGDGTPGSGASVYDYDANTITDVPGLQNKDQRDQSASVLLPPAQDQRVLTMGGGNVNTNPEGNRLTDIIDLKAANPSYVAGPLLPQGTVDQGTGPKPETGAQGKMYVSAVLLPDGNVFETGGGLHDRADPVYEASMFDPTTNAFTPMAPDPQKRTYHSSSFLLPDGRVMSTGDNPGNGTWNHNVSIYTPPYLLKGARPSITSVINSQWKYGDTQRITVDRPIAKAELIRPAAVTHSSDPNQRFVDLPMSVINGKTIDLNVTSNPNLAPPGWYMLFGVDANGIPSVAQWVHLGGPTALDATASAAHVHSFADDLSASPKSRTKKRASAPVSTTISGCDRHYGTVNVCVPTVFPATVKRTTAARCAWLGSHGYGRLKVNGDDPLRLDPDRNGVACRS
ncbi:galactose oxidase early set domain-containing protein [Streptomyces sp. NBC_01465]|uniref:galactose oxidase early set domain-containing protein n=1 Tax=Streptomyces sp. NBC_01465 TaxID=2903878 RepID=UPI002E3519CA|nr:galactose oxidase early set domain-containing protein [Streptomyces sp. NBC_01465]